MSIVAPPSLQHQPFSEADLYPVSGPESSQPPSPAQQHPFPAFQHRHTSPNPVLPQSFSALGPPNTSVNPRTALAASPPPDTPAPTTISLPSVAQDTENDMMGTALPPTPDMPFGHSALFPHTMVKLAPPADEKYSLHPASHSTDVDTAPRRFPTLDLRSSPSSVVSTPGPSRTRAKTTSDGADKPAASVSPRTKSTGPARRDIRRSQTSVVVPTSARMVESRSDSRNRAKTAAKVARSTSGKILSLGRGDSPNFARTLTAPDALASPPPTSARDASPPDLGGPDGLEAKVVLLGSQGVGKTSLILRYTKGVFSPVTPAATIGSSLHTRKLVHHGVRVKLQIWDTAGQERFRSMAPIYYRGAHVCVLVYDIGNRQSFEDVRSWLEELGRTVPKETVIYIVGSKIDLDYQGKRVVK